MIARRQLLRAAAALPLIAFPGVPALLRAAEPDLSALSDITTGTTPITKPASPVRRR